MYGLTFTVSSFNTATTATNYLTIQLNSVDAGASSALGAPVSTQNDTQNQFVNHSSAVNAVIASTVECFDMALTESGAMTSYLMASMTYRLVG